MRGTSEDDLIDTDTLLPSKCLALPDTDTERAGMLIACNLVNTSKEEISSKVTLCVTDVIASAIVSM